MRHHGRVIDTDVRAVSLPDAAVDLARAALIDDVGAAAVGDYAGCVAEEGTAVSAQFDSLEAGYRGWRWSVTMAALPGADWTICEVVLLPGPEALVAPEWVPWDQRVRAGDLGVGDLLPAPADDYRLVPAYVSSDDPAVEELASEVGLGRERVMSRDGRIDLAERWHEGSYGPGDEMAVHAPGRCGSCGFYLPLAGSLGRLFGACGNDMAPADGRVVDIDYGCGAHSEAAAEALWPAQRADVVVDELALDIVVHAPDRTAGPADLAPLALAGIAALAGFPGSPAARALAALAAR